MSRLNKLMRWVLEPSHAGRTVFFTNTNEKTIGTNTKSAVCLAKDPESGWKLVARIPCAELVQIGNSLCLA